MATFRAARTFIRTSDAPARQLTLVDEFWTNVDAEIQNGEVPKA